MRKRTFSIILAAALMLSACGAPAETTTTTTTAAAQTTEATSAEEITATTTTTTTAATTTPAPETSTEQTSETEETEPQSVYPPAEARECDGARIKEYMNLFVGADKYFTKIKDTGGDAMSETYCMGVKIRSIVTAGGETVEMLVDETGAYTIFSDKKIALKVPGADMSDLGTNVELENTIAFQDTTVFYELETEFGITEYMVAQISGYDAPYVAEYTFDDVGTLIKMGSEFISYDVIDYGTDFDESIFSLADYHVIDMDNPTEEDMAVLEGLYTS